MLFLTLAALVARWEGVRDVVVIAENGASGRALSLNSPRIGAFSTHTAHPEFVEIMGNVLSTLLKGPRWISSPCAINYLAGPLLLA